MIEQAKSTCSPLRKAFGKQMKTIENQGEKQIKATEQQGKQLVTSNAFDEKNNLYTKLIQKKKYFISLLQKEWTQ